MIKLKHPVDKTDYNNLVIAYLRAVHANPLSTVDRNLELPGILNPDINSVWANFIEAATKSYIPVSKEERHLGLILNFLQYCGLIKIDPFDDINSLSWYDPSSRSKNVNILSIKEALAKEKLKCLVSCSREILQSMRLERHLKVVSEVSELVSKQGPVLLRRLDLRSARHKHALENFLPDILSPFGNYAPKNFYKDPIQRKKGFYFASNIDIGFFVRHSIKGRLYVECHLTMAESGDSLSLPYFKYLQLLRKHFPTFLR